MLLPISPSQWIAAANPNLSQVPPVKLPPELHEKTGSHPADAVSETAVVWQRSQTLGTPPISVVRIVIS